MANTSNKVLYIDNVTTYDYVKNHRAKHVVNNPNSGRFTYVVFTEYERPNNYGYSYHGDIFFNGNKITYINDVDVTSPITDGKDTFIGYVTNLGGLDFARSTILINNLSNTYELFNVSNDTITVSYEYQSNLGYYTTEHEGTWDCSIIQNDADEIIIEGSSDENMTSGQITCSNCSGNVEIHLSYTFTINEGDKETTCTDYAYYKIYKIAEIEHLDFGYTPDTLSYSTIFTPLVNIEPADAVQSPLRFESSNTDVIEILNTYTGTFICKKPGTSIITCSYNIASTLNANTETKQITVSKVNPHLTITVHETAHLYDDPEYPQYGSTCCYAHYDTLGLDTSEYNWYLNNSTNIIMPGSTATKSSTISHGDLRSDDINLVKFTLPDSLYTNSSAVIQLYAPSQEILDTQSITITNYQYHQDTNTVTFVIEAVANTNDSGTHFVDTNYSFDNSIGFSDFTITDITVSGNTTYTTVTASVATNHLNDIYAQYVAEYNQNAGIENTGVTCYNIISVHTSDASFIDKSYMIPYTVNTEIYDISNSVNLNTQEAQQGRP